MQGEGLALDYIVRTTMTIDFIETTFNSADSAQKQSAPESFFKQTYY